MVRLMMQTLLADNHRENLVVGLCRRQTARQVAGDGLRLQEEASAGELVRRDGEIDPVFDPVAVTADDLVQCPCDLAGIAGNFGQAFLVVVEFLQRHDWQEDIVFLEAIDAGGIVQQNIGVEHKKLGLRGGDFRCFCAGNSLVSHERVFSG